MLYEYYYNKRYNYYKKGLEKILIKNIILRCKNNLSNKSY